jgi:hypothetical protein
MIEVSTTTTTYYMTDREFCDFMSARLWDGRLIGIQEISHNGVPEHFNEGNEQDESIIFTDAVLRVCNGDSEHGEVNWGRDGF